MQFHDFELILGTNPDGSYAVRSRQGAVKSARAATRSRRGPVGSFEAQFSEEILNELSYKMAGNRRALRARYYSPEDTRMARQFGNELFSALVAGKIEKAYRAGRAAARRDHAFFRMILDLTAAPSLLNYPWEFLYDSKERAFVVAAADGTLIRLFEVDRSVTPKKVNGPLNVLIVSAKPDGLPPLNIDEEVVHLLTVTRNALAPRVKVEHLENPRLLELKRKLDATPHGHYDVLHFIGHGAFSRDTKAGTLSFRGKNGRIDHVGMDRFTQVVQNRGISLAVINSCEGGRTDAGSPFEGVAQSLLGARFTAVIAMQFEITDSSAVSFSSSLYEALATPDVPIDLAVSRARALMLADEETLEWATPVLYLGASISNIFEFTQPAAAPATALKGHPVKGERLRQTVPEPASVAQAAGEVRPDIKSKAWKIAKALLIGSLYGGLKPAAAASFSDTVLGRLLDLNGQQGTTLIDYTRWFIELTLLRKSAEAADAPHGSAGINNEAWRWLRHSRVEHLDSHKRTFELIIDGARKGNMSFAVPTRFALDGLMTQEPPVDMYFAALEVAAHELGAERTPTLRLGQTDRFATTVEIGSGFLAPLYLMTSSLAEFKEQWQSALKGFERANGPGIVSAEPALELQKLQAFLWYCWILWGPSIQVCTCSMWTPGKALLQHGYGDENNSLPVIVEDDPEAEYPLIEQSWASIKKHIVEDGGPPYPLAVQTSLSAKIAWGDRYIQQRGVPQILKVAGGDRAANHDRLILLNQRVISGPHALARSEPYYSAYLWVMFEICDPGNRTGFLDHSWRRFLPVFEHGNIANANTLYLLKQQLARKALSTVADMESRFARAFERDEPHSATGAKRRKGARGDSQTPVYFRYVCAIDDTGSFHDAHHAHKIRFRIEEAESYRIRSIMDRELPAHKSLDPKRLFPALDRPLPDGGKRYASCDLPLILREFFDYVKHSDGAS